MPVLGQSESDVEDEGSLGVFPGRDAVEDLNGDAALEEVVEDDQALEEVTAETVDFLDGEHVAGADMGHRLEEDGAVLGGEGSNLQDNVSCHVDDGFPLTIGRGVSVGHGAVLHGCTIEHNVLIGMSATVLNGSVIGAGSLVAAGTVVLEGSIIPPCSLVAGVPGKVRRELSDDEVAGITKNAQTYQELARLHSS